MTITVVGPAKYLGTKCQSITWAVVITLKPSAGIAITSGVQRVTDLYLAGRPSRVRIENLHQGWLTAGGEVESLDQFLSRLIGQA